MLGSPSLVKLFPFQCREFGKGIFYTAGNVQIINVSAEGEGNVGMSNLSTVPFHIYFFNPPASISVYVL